MAQQNIYVNDGNAICGAVKGFFESTTAIHENASVCLKELQELGPNCGPAIEKFVGELGPMVGIMQNVVEQLEGLKKQWTELEGTINKLAAVANCSLD